MSLLLRRSTQLYTTNTNTSTSANSKQTQVQIQSGQQIPPFQYATKNCGKFRQKAQNLKLSKILLDGAQISVQERIPTFLGYFGSVNMVSVSSCHF